MLACMLHFTVCNCMRMDLCHNVSNTGKIINNNNHGGPGWDSKFVNATAVFHQAEQVRHV